MGVGGCSDPINGLPLGFLLLPQSHESKSPFGTGTAPPVKLFARHQNFVSGKLKSSAEVNQLSRSGSQMLGVDSQCIK